FDIIRDGQVCFDWWGSTESGYDMCRFRIDGSVQIEDSGTWGWSNHCFSVTAGSREFRFEYSKDVSASSGTDECRVDNISMPNILENCDPCTVYCR
ncbi:MAG: hypothetical protein JRI55_04720, partial [Deltaproteobacteria bacterium]|nr:hypothetical protein [Deltaproteobacteria bacterium]